MTSNWSDFFHRTLLSGNAALPVAPATYGSTCADGIDLATAEDILVRATADLGTAWPQPLASDAARVHEDGNRDDWEQPALARQRRLSRAAVAAAITGETQWISEVINGVTLLCEQTSWCWPAHDDTRERHGAVLATVSDPFVDLGAGEVVGQLAWIDQLLGDPLDTQYPGVRERIRHEARLRIFDPFIARRDWHWIGLDGDVHNWNPWIHGNIMVGALRLLDAEADTALRADVVSLCVEGIDRYVASLPADGAIDEGYSYWWNGACRALEALDILAHATDGAFDPTPHVTSLKETVAFPHRSHLGADWYLNLADGQAKPTADQPWHSLHRAAVRVNNIDARHHASSYRLDGVPAASESEGLGRLLRGMTDHAWLAAHREEPPLPQDVWLPSTEVLLARSQGGTSAGLCLAVKGGHNDEHHNHNDVGSFVVASDGVPVIVDAGRPTYTKQTFGPDRYDIWTMQSTWHNVPEVQGRPQPAGAQSAASDVRATIESTHASLSSDLSNAYDVAELQSWRRVATLDRPQERVSIHDSWRWSDGTSTPDAAAPTISRVLLAGVVTLLPDGAHVVPLEGATPLRLRWPADVPATQVVRQLDDPMLTSVWGSTLTRIDLDVTALRDLTITIERDVMIKDYA